MLSMFITHKSVLSVGITEQLDKEQTRYFLVEASFQDKKTQVQCLMLINFHSSFSNSNEEVMYL